jgi:hypothetical protein
MPPAAGSASTAIAASALRSPAASAAPSKRAGSVSQRCRTLACKPFLPCRVRNCSRKCASLLTTAECTAARKPSRFWPGKSGGPGRSMPRLNCPASRAVSASATAGLPIIGHACREHVPQGGRQFTTTVLFHRKENITECCDGFCGRIGRNHGRCSRSPSVPEKSSPNSLDGPVRNGRPRSFLDRFFQHCVVSSSTRACS